MSLTNKVEELARNAAMVDVADLPGLVRLQDELTDMAESLEEPDLEPVAKVAHSAAAKVESIVLRMTDDADATLAEIHKAIDYAQQVAEAVQAGLDPSSVPQPETPAETDVDMELVSAWVSSSTSALGDLEAAVVSIDAGDEDAGQEGEARRIIHTIKGEAGILAFESLQKVCHDCETLIDLARDNGAGFPVEQVLALVDWLRACIEVISSDPAGELPPRDEVHRGITDAIEQIQGGTADTPEESAESSSETPVAETASEPTDAVAESDEASAPVAPEASSPEAQETEPVETEAAPTPASSGPELPQIAPEDDGPVAFPEEAVIDETAAEFVCEAREHIANAEQSLLDLESDLANNELINTVFRAFHTIKGVAGFMHLTPIVSLTHVAETLLDQARSGTLALTPDHLDLFLRSCDTLSQLIDAIQEGEPPLRSVLETLVVQLDYACKTGEAPPAGAAQPGDEAQAQTTEPASESAETETPGADAEATPVEPDEGAGQAEAADESGQSGEPQPDAPQADAKPDTKPETKPKAAAPAKAQQKSAARVEQTVKVNTGRMDALVDMVGELVIGYQMVYQDESIQGIKAQNTQRTLTHVSKIIRDLQEVAMSLRLVTLRSTFQKMARLVRDVSSKASKNIRFHVEGEDVELDRTVVEEIADPLVHMIRNACDHGIEPSAERREAGKTPEGNLYLRAYHSGGSIVIEITDDGRGLNREKLIKKALDKGVIPADRDPSEMSDREVYNLIFAPGFSTADKVTDISGRGVGMDVVRRNIEALRGKIEISSTYGKGSSFKMRLPLTMAIIDGMIVRVGSQRYVIPTLAIEQSFRPQEGDIHTVIGQGETVQVRGSLLPVYRANQVFGLGEGVDDPGEGLLLVLEAHNQRFCLLVDEIVGQQQVVIKNLGHGLAPISGVSGGAILGDGRVALILDIAGIVSEATKTTV